MRPDTLSPDVRDQLHVVRKHLWLIAAVTMLALAVSYAVSSQQTERYTATARVLVESGGTQPPELATESQRVASVAVADRVVEDLGLGTEPGRLLMDLSVRPVTDEGSVIGVTYTTTDAEQAARVANGFADAYIAHLRQEATERAGEATREIEAISANVQADLDRVIRQLEAAREAGESGRVATLESERALLTTRLGALQQRLTDVELSATNAPSGEVFAPATVPGSPSSPNTPRNLVFAGLVGLAAGIGIAFMRERLDDSFRDRFILQRVTERPVLGTIPRFRSKKRDTTPILLRDPTSMASEAYRNMRAHVDFLTERDGIKSITITSAHSEEGKTETTRNLGIALARAGRRVLLVSADLRRPTLEDVFEVPKEKGLSTWLNEGGHVRPFIHKSPVRDLLVLPAGPAVADPAEMLGSDQMKDLLAQLQSGFDVVLLDSPPVLPVADALILAGGTQGTILVVQAGRTREPEIRLALDQLEEVETKVLGTVLNRFDPGSTPYSNQGTYKYFAREVVASPSAEESRTANGSHPLRRGTDLPPPPP